MCNHRERAKHQETDTQKKEGNSVFIHRQHQGDKLHLCFIGCQDLGLHNKTLNCLSDTLASTLLL